MIQEISLRIPPEIAYNPMRLKAEASTSLGIDINRIKSIRIARRSIDARQRKVMVNILLKVAVDADEPISLSDHIDFPDVRGKKEVTVVGAGPAGLFAALRLITLGFRPIVLERGKDVDSRRLDMAAIARQGEVDPDSNYCFGEGGAGAFSDGKLYTRSKKRGSVDRILAILHQHGASEDILVDAHPHIGTDKLPEVIKAMRRTIVSAGGEVHFSTCVTDLILDGNEITGVIDRSGHIYPAPVILATGHSARDVYELLHKSNIRLEAKGIAVGVRLEHPQQLIDRIQYHSPAGRGKYLPAAEYSMLTRVGGRGVYSFCMCPGGFIIPAASAPGQMVVNGMSPSSRGTRWANSGMVVEVLPEDVEGGDDPLKMMRFQEKIERRFFEEGDGSQNAPAQRMKDFTEGKASTDLPPVSYAPGVHPARVDRLLPPEVATRLQEGFRVFGAKSRGFLTNEAVVIGDETRTSAPVRIPRLPDSLRHVDIQGLYPCGEGAGYAGGIVSAAIDGERCAEAVAALLGE